MTRAADPPTSPAVAPRIWCVDDNPDDRELVVRAVRQAYPDARTVTPTDEASLAAALASEPPDAVVTDYRLGWSDGLEVLDRVQALHPFAPVIMFTNTGSEEVCAEGMKRGLYDYVLKRGGQYAKIPHALRLALERAATRRELLARREELERSRAELAELLASERRARADAERAREEAEAARAEALEAARLKDEFLATLSHELRTPLNAVLGWAEVMRLKRAGDTELAHALAVISRNARQQAHLIADLLDMSRIVSGQIRMADEPVDLVQTVAAAMQAVQPSAEQAGVGIASELDPEVGTVRGDGGRLQQVVWNLLTNAVKFTPAGGHVHVRLARSGDSAEIRVTDDGAGIAPEFLPHVFERFRQAEGSTTRAHGGLGLGLAIVKSLVDLHGGRVTAHSAGRGHGAEFVVTLPLAGDGWRDRREAAQPEVPPHDWARTERSLHGLAVLVIDDDRDTCGVVSRILEHHGARVICEWSAAAGLRLLEEKRPDVLLSDIGMPGEDGYAFIRRVRQLPSERGGTIPAAALTAFARSEDRQRALLAGFDSYSTKPVEPGELVAVVATLGARARAARD